MASPRPSSRNSASALVAVSRAKADLPSSTAHWPTLPSERAPCFPGLALWRPASRVNQPGAPLIMADMRPSASGQPSLLSTGNHRPLQGIMLRACSPMQERGVGERPANMRLHGLTNHLGKRRLPGDGGTNTDAGSPVVCPFWESGSADQGKAPNRPTPEVRGPPGQKARGKHQGLIRGESLRPGEDARQPASGSLSGAENGRRYGPSGKGTTRVP